VDYVNRGTLKTVPQEFQDKVNAVLSLDPDDPASKAAIEEISREIAEEPVAIPVCWRSDSILAAGNVANADVMPWMVLNGMFDPRDLGIAAS